MPRVSYAVMMTRASGGVRREQRRAVRECVVTADRVRRVARELTRDHVTLMAVICGATRDGAMRHTLPLDIFRDDASDAAVFATR